MRRMMLTLMALYLPVVMFPQEIESVMGLSGAVYEEDIPSDEVEKFNELASRPLNINTAPLSRLISTGLFSKYQAASVADYRSRNGDILSIEELAAVDGIGDSYARLLAPFLDFSSYALPGMSSVRPRTYVHSAVLKASSRTGIPSGTAGIQNLEYSYGMKYRFCVNDMIEAAVTCRTPYGGDLFPPGASSYYLAYYGRGALGKIVLGDFNARFGQGLAMWSGFSMSGAPSPGAFSRRPSGISPYWSYSGEGSHRGVAADLAAGKFLISVFAAVTGTRELIAGSRNADVTLVPCANLAWNGLDGQASVTWVATSRTLYGTGKYALPEPSAGGGAFFESSIVSADFSYSYKGTDFFTEAACDISSWAVAVLAGCRFRPSDSIMMAAGARCYPGNYESSYSGAMRSSSSCTNEYGATFSGEFSAGDYVQLKGRSGFGSSELRHRGEFSIDAAYWPSPRYGTDGPSGQLKAVAAYSWRISPSFSLQMKVSEKMRTYGNRFRTDVRCDVKYISGALTAAMRFNMLNCIGTGLLSYAEAGYAPERYSVHLRGGLFRIDNWDDRIYAYERDAPGNFSVPSFYGRGFWVSAVASVKLAFRIRLYLRASYTGYPWQLTAFEKEKPGRAELKIQTVMDF